MRPAKQGTDFFDNTYRLKARRQVARLALFLGKVELELELLWSRQIGRLLRGVGPCRRRWYG